jgi:Predicted membrane protein (DUF2214)
MTSLTLSQLLLVLHITGFTMMAGTIVADFTINRRLNRYLITDKGKALHILDGTAGLLALVGIGAILLIATGIGLVAIFRETVTSMLWFRIKMVLVVIVVVNGVALAKPTSMKLRNVLVENSGAGPIEALKNRLRNVYVLQMLLFLIIFVLSVFKF